jgi:penicillin-binding protein 1C
LRRRAKAVIARAAGTLTASAIALGLAWLALDAAFPFPLERLERPPARVVLDREGEPLRLFLPRDDTWRLPVRLDEVSPDLVRAVVASEDRWFEWHPGVNPLAVARAALANLRAGRVVSGASTIPMQIARLVERRPRTLVSKGIEAFRALQLERRFDKRELLTLYLNLAPYGGNLEGVAAASRFYLGKRPRDLSIGELALLTALPRAPVAYDPTRDAAAARAARDRVLDQLAARGLFTRDDVADAKRQEVPHRRRAIPFRAPHFARWAATRHPDEPLLETTIDARVQRVSARLAGVRVRELRELGIDNVAVVVIENRTRTLRARVGSAAFFDPAHDGQVDAATAARSPGSALKPFLYGLAFDAGVIVPDTWLLDVPTDYAGYVAENYDGQYRGRVSARTALVHSLNAPAVSLLARVGVPRFLELLRRGGLRTLRRPAREYGLPLVLGAAEVTLADLTNLYATLAAGGLHRPLRWTRARATGATGALDVRLLSPEAVDLLLDVLTEVKRPDLPESWRLARDVPAIAWKTGTSYGHRDAWAIGLSEHYTIGVWTGNPDGRGSPGISGAEHAAPLLLDLFRALERSGSRLPRPTDARRARVEVCALSHELPGPFCPRTLQIPVLAGSSRLRTCTHHRRLFIDAQTGARLAGACLAQQPHRSRVVEVYPPALVAWWHAQGRPVDPVPPLHPACREVPGDAPPHIVSPSGATPYRVRREAPREHQRLELAARTAPGTARLYWYQDGRLVGAARPDEALFTPLVRGHHRLVVVDDGGRSAALEYAVE